MGHFDPIPGSNHSSQRPTDWTPFLELIMMTWYHNETKVKYKKYRIISW